VTDARRSAPHVARNTAPILDVLRETLPEKGLVLEVASGSGEQSLAFARAFPKLLWQPSDPDPAALASIQGWRESGGVFNLLPPVELDARAVGWPIASAEAIVCINMVHISPWEATEGLMRGAGRLLEPGAPLFLYGPYRRQGVPTAPSNETFDQSLKARDPRWGLRTVEEIAAEAERQGLKLERVVEMPANNLSLVFRRISPLP
jgi:SAM-dependent methyltransferase